MLTVFIWRYLNIIMNTSEKIETCATFVGVTLLLCACTKKKTRSTPDKLRFRTLPQCKAQDLAAVWLNRTESLSQSEKLPARALYAGPGWRAALTALHSATKQGASGADLLILSAGFGLLHQEDEIPSYDASFSSGIDQIAGHISSTNSTGFTNSDEAHRNWWHAINMAQGKSATPCADLAQRYPGAYIVIAAGKHYISAIRNDLLELAQSVGPERLFIISLGYPWKTADKNLSRCAIPASIEVERLLPGARSSINGQLLSWLFIHAGPIATWNRDQIRSLIEQRLETHKQTHPPVPQRLSPTIRRMNDEQVSDWIHAQLQENVEVSRTVLLRRLRTEDHRSCSQERFETLFKKQRTIVFQNRVEAEITK